MKKYFLLTISLLFTHILLFAQGTLEDYNRAYSLRQKYENKVFYSEVQPEWIANTHFFWYVRETPAGKSYILTDAGKQEQRNLFDTSLLAGLLSTGTGKTVNSQTLTLENMQVLSDLNTINFNYSKYQWNYKIKENKIIKGLYVKTPINTEVYDDELRSRPIKSPDGKKEARIKNRNICVKDILTGMETMISKDGTSNDYYSANIEWSPDSKRIACMKIKPAETKYLYLLESSPSAQLVPKLQKRKYTRPGDPLPFRQPRIFNLLTGECIAPSTSLYSSQYMLWNLKWNDDSKAVTFEYNQRGHQVYRILELSAETGNVRSIINETSDTYIYYKRRYRYDMKNSSEIIWSSERDNWNHLYLYNKISGVVNKQITKGEWYVREIQYVDEQKRQIYFSANGMTPNQDPYFIRYYRINMDGSGLICLTPEEGMHTAFYSSDMRYLVDVCSMTNMPPVAVLRNAKDGHILLSLEKADISALLAIGWSAPEKFVAKGRDGKTDMWGLIFRPSNFNPKIKYPVIEYIYSAPGESYVPKSFYAVYKNPTPLVELGFIVVQVDCMSTSYRSKAFESICYKNLKDAGLPDRIAWIKAAAKKYPYMDINRVGIFGASAGGQEAMTATLFYPDFYKAAYASCGCHDNRLGNIWWNEQWMGYPVDNSYKECSNVENAHLLKTPLMLVVGELDDNVDPASTMQVVNALVKSGKDFDLVFLPGTNHTMGEEYGEHKRFDFFVKNLLGVTPPSWDKVKTTPLK